MSGCCQQDAAPAARSPAGPASCCGASSGNPEKGAEWAILGALILLSGLSMNVSLAVNLSSLEGDTRLLLHGGLALAGIVAFALGGTDLLRPAWRAICERRIVTEHLFLAGIAAAWVVSVHATLTGAGAVFYEVPILLPAIRRFGSILLGRQRGTIESAMQELFAGIGTVRVWQNGGWNRVPVADVALGDRILVRAGEVIPTDAVIVSGQAFVQTGSLTGEPFPVVLGPGGTVSSGMIPMDGDLEMEVKAPAAASALSGIAVSTRDLLERPPPFLRSAERTLRWFFPMVLFTSISTLVFWVGYADWQTAISNSLAVVLVACPCAFGMALPLIFRRGLAACLKCGIEPTDAAFMESLSLVKIVAFDKTGTLTIPEMGVTSLVCAPEAEEKSIRAVLAALHSRSSHPVARPFWRWAAEGVDVEIQDFVIRPGRGVEASARVDGKWQFAKLGNESFLSTPAPEWAKRGGSQRQLFIEINGTLQGVCMLTEQLRSSAAATCRVLAAGGWRTVVLTGDATVPDDLSASVEEIRVSQLPSDKAECITQWENSAWPVLFMGDGLNDAPALAAASASIAVGTESSFAAASAHAHWKQPDFAALPGLLDTARGLADRARVILRTALTYNILGMAVAAAGYLHPVAAAVLMLISSATVMILAARPLAWTGRTAVTPRPSFQPVTACRTI